MISNDISYVVIPERSIYRAVQPLIGSERKFNFLTGRWEWREGSSRRTKVREMTADEVATWEREQDRVPVYGPECEVCSV
jgi:hypothetical protein